MSVLIPETGLRLFGVSNYEVLDEDFAFTHAVMICGRAARAPRIGDRFNVESGGTLHDLAVEEVRSFRGGWSVICRSDE